MISTKKTNDNGTESSFVNKSLQPGNTVIKVDKIYLEDFLPDQKQENIWYRECEDYKYEHKGFPVCLE